MRTYCACANFDRVCYIARIITVHWFVLGGERACAAFVTSRDPHRVRFHVETINGMNFTSIAINNATNEVNVLTSFTVELKLYQ